MWLFTTGGFYSVVTAEEFGHELQVRARCPEDLDRLRQAHLPGLGPNVSIAGRDYPFRAYTTRAELADALVRIAEDLDYPNFKSAVAARLGPQRAHTYADVWRACLPIEDEAPGPAAGAPAGRA